MNSLAHESTSIVMTTTTNTENEVAISLLKLSHEINPSLMLAPIHEVDSSSVIQQNPSTLHTVTPNPESPNSTLSGLSLFQNIQETILHDIELSSIINKELEGKCDSRMFYDSYTTKCIVDSAIACLMRDRDHTLYVIQKRGPEIFRMARERERYREKIGTPVTFSPIKFSSEGLSGIMLVLAGDLGIPINLI